MQKILIALLMECMLTLASEELYSCNKIYDIRKQPLKGCKWKKNDNGVILMFCSIYFKLQSPKETAFNLDIRWFSINFILKTFPDEWRNSTLDLYPHYIELQSEKYNFNLNQPSTDFLICIKEIVYGFIKEYFIKIDFPDYLQKPVAHINTEELNFSSVNKELSYCNCGLHVNQNLYWPYNDNGFTFKPIIQSWITVWKEYLRRAKVKEFTITLSDSITKLPSELISLKGVDIHMFTCYKCWLKTIETVYYFSNSQILRFPFNKISYIKPGTFLSTPNLIELDLRGNLLSGFPKAILFPPKLLFVDLGGQISEFFTLTENFHLSNNMTSIRLSETDLEYLPNYSFRCCSLLKSLYLKKCKITNISPKSFKGLAFLELLDISENEISNIMEETFEDLTELQILFLNKNRIVTIEESLFRPITKIKFLDLSENNIKLLPTGIFQNLYNLEIINLFHNQIISWKLNTFRNLSALRYLNLSRNYINTLDESMIEDLNPITEVWLTKNPFDCNSCNLPLLVKWLKDKISPDSYFRYSCAFTKKNPKRIEIMNVTFNEKLCVVISVNYFINVGVPLIILTFAIITLIIMGYRYRWFVRHFIFYVRIKISNYEEIKNSNEFLYDVFISYSSEDFQFAKKLVDKMEKDFGLRVCIDERDFLAGNDITDNIINTIHNSRKVMFVLSKNFIENGFCQFEMRIAQNKFFERNNSLILLKYGELPENISSKRLRYLLRTWNYLEWFDNEESLKVFWLRLENALKKNMPSDKDESFI